MEHKFEFNGQPVTYRSGTVRDREARGLIARKLIDACGGNENISELESDVMWTYAKVLAQTSPIDADWWREASDTAERIYEGYALFAEAPGEVYDRFRLAEKALQEPEKKS